MIEHGRVHGLRWDAFLGPSGHLQAGLARVRSRFGYASIAHNELRLARGLGVAPHAYLSQLAASNEREEDALQTVLRVLLYRAARRKWRGR